MCFQPILQIRGKRDYWGVGEKYYEGSDDSKPELRLILISQSEPTVINQHREALRHILIFNSTVKFPSLVRRDSICFTRTALLCKNMYAGVS